MFCGFPLRVPRSKAIITHTHTCARALTRRHLGNATVQDYAFGEVVIGEVPPWETDEIWEVDDEYDNDDDTQTRWLKRSSRSRQARRARRRLKSRSSSSNDDTHYQVVVHVWRLNQYPETTNETVKRFACACARVIFPYTLVTMNACRRPGVQVPLVAEEEHEHHV